MAASKTASKKATKPRKTASKTAAKKATTKSAAKPRKKAQPLPQPTSSLARPKEDPVDKETLAVAEEEAVREARAMLRSVIQQAGISQAILAERIEVTRSNVSQVLERGEGNPTVRTCARWLRACGYRLVLSFEPMGEE